MDKLFSTNRELKKIKKIHAKAFKKYDSFIRSSSRSDSDSSRSSDIKLYEIRQSDEWKYMNKLYQVVTSNVKNNNQCDDAIKYEPKFDDKCSLSSGTNKEPCQ